MKKIIAIIIIATSVVSCKKENTIDPPVIPPAKKLVEIKYQEYPGSNLVYSYDNLGRVITQESSGSKYSYAYSPGKCVYENYSKAQNRIYITGDYTLDNSGLVSYSMQTVFGTPNTSYTFESFFEYDAWGHVINWKFKYSNSPTQHERKYTYTDGNLTEVKNLANGNIVTIDKFTYSNIPDKLNVNTASDISSVKNLYGTGNKNLRAALETYDINNIKVSEGTLTYEMDAQGYPAKLTYHDVLNNKDTHTTYYYDK
jgi:hypothetical protein